MEGYTESVSQAKDYDLHRKSIHYPLSGIVGDLGGL